MKKALAVAAIVVAGLFTGGVALALTGDEAPAQRARSRPRPRAQNIVDRIDRVLDHGHVERVDRILDHRIDGIHSVQRVERVQRFDRTTRLHRVERIGI